MFLFFDCGIDKGTKMKGKGLIGLIIDKFELPETSTFVGFHKSLKHSEGEVFNHPVN